MFRVKIGQFNLEVIQKCVETTTALNVGSKYALRASLSVHMHFSPLIF